MSATYARALRAWSPATRLLSVSTFALAVFAQTQTGSLSGTVTDTAGAAIAGASVDATSASSGITLHTVSSEAGIYVFPSLTTGLWTITAEKPGFKKLVRSNIEIFIAQRQSLDLTLEVGDVTQSVQVLEKQTMLDAETSEKGQNLTPRMYQTLPLWSGGLQNPSAFLSYMAGVNSAAGIEHSRVHGPRPGTVDRRREQRDSGIRRNGF